MEDKKLPENTRVIFEDEMRIGLCPRMFREWWLPDMRHHVEATVLDQKKWTLFGGVDIGSGELTLLAKERGRTLEFKEFCDKLSERYKNETIYLVLDNSRIHLSREFNEYLVNHPNLIMIYLPTYSFYLNVIELLWLYARKAVYYNNQFHKIEWLVEEVLKFLNSLTPERVLKAVGIK